MFARNANRTLLTAVAALALAGSAPGASAQETADARWLPWLGCWVEVGAPADAPMRCFVPDGPGVTEMIVGSGGGVDQQALVADGVERAADIEGCAGVRDAEFSADGTRVYTRDQLTCEGGTERSTRGMMAWVAPDQWIQARAMQVAGQSAGWVRRYRAAPASRVAAAGLESITDAVESRQLAIESARMAASAPIGVEDVIEAYGRTEGEAVRSWIVEQDEPIRLDADRLVMLAEAGIPEDVIDVMIAVSYPDRFQVARQATGDAREGYRRTLFPAFGWSSGWPYYYGAYYSPFGYGSRSLYGGLYGYYPYNYRGAGTVIVVQTRDESDNRGRAVNGRGYTRGSTGTANPSSGLRPTRASVGRAGYSGSRGTSAGAAAATQVQSKAKAKRRGGNN
jgi:hypothetical protein